MIITNETVNGLQGIVKHGSDEWYLKEIEEEYTIRIKERVHTPSILSEDTQKQITFTWDCAQKVHRMKTIEATLQEVLNQ